MPRSLLFTALLLAAPILWWSSTSEPTAGSLLSDASERLPGPLDSFQPEGLLTRRPRPTDATRRWPDRLRAAGEFAEAGQARQDAPPFTVEELMLRIEAVLQEHRVPGLGIALINRWGVFFAGGAGVADRSRGTPVDGDTVFRVGSISKSVVALALLGLVEEGRLQLSTPVAEMLPEVEMHNQWSDSDPVTVAHLLEHTAGFDDMRFNELFLAPGAEDPTLTEALARNPRSRASRWRPGSRAAYSNPGYTVAGAVIEAVTGMPFERYVEERVLRPSAMPTASFSFSPELAERLATGYGGLNSRKALPVQRLYHRPAGELMSSPRELGQLVHLLLSRGQSEHGRVFQASSIARMERNETRAFPQLASGYGLGNQGDTSHAVPTRGHGGGVPGFLSEYSYATGLGVGYVLTMNAISDEAVAAFWQIRALVFAYLTCDMELPEPPSIELPASELARHVGSYELAGPRHELVAFIDRVLASAEVSLVEDRLLLELGNGALIPLIPTGIGRFRTPWHSGTMLAFDTLADGTRVLTIGDTYYEEGDAWLIQNRRRALGLAMWFMDIGFFWNIVWLPGWLILVLRFRRRFPLPADALPALACACFLIMKRTFIAGATSGALGEVGFMSVLFLVATLAFPVLSILALASALRSVRRDVYVDAALDELVEDAGFITHIYSDGWQRKLYHLATGLACVGLSVYLTYHGIIGLRTWAW